MALSEGQQMRVDALQAARGLLQSTESKGPFTAPSKAAPAVHDLFEMSDYIIYGGWFDGQQYRTGPAVIETGIVEP